jgi:ubiquinone/menaquinone biosynthesis C-methylase UbiE
LLLIIKIRWWEIFDALIARHKKILARSDYLRNKLMLGPMDLPVPPAQLRGRVGNPSRIAHTQIGPKIRDRLLNHVARYAEPKKFQRVMEWGCGCGRISRAMLKVIPEDRFYGCDIDPDAISWMKNTFVGSSFITIDPMPPTPYEEGYFDFIYGISVFTHLDEEIQFKWLTELRRIINRSGIVAVTVHAGDESMKSKILKQLESRGFVDWRGDRWILFNHFLDNNYYRLTKHSKDYVMREWSQYFDILGYIERGIGRQDLIIMRPHP